VADRQDFPAWQVIHRRQVADASPWLRLWVETIRLPDGRIIDDYYTLDIPDFVVIVALTPNGDLLAERFYRHSPRRVVLSLPAGYIKEGESPLIAAQRELAEETGYTGGDWQALGAFTVDGNRGAGSAHIFLARGVEPGMPLDDDDLEERQVLLMPQQEFLGAIQSGGVRELVSIGSFLLAYTHLAQEVTHV